MVRIIDLKGKERKFDTLNEACQVLEGEGQLPGEIVGLFLEPHDGGRAVEPVVWPSEADPSSSCRREIALKRLQGEGIAFDLRRVWDRLLGLGIEAALARAELDGWLYQPSVPDDILRSGKFIVIDDVLVGLAPGQDGQKRWAVRSDVLGCNLRGRIDRLSLDGKTIIDWKVTGYPGPGRDWGLNSGWVFQLQLYAHMMRLLLEDVTSEEQKLEIWRVYRDPYVWKDQGPGRPKKKMADIDVAFRRFEVPVWDDEKLLEKVGDHCRSTDGILRALAEDPASVAEILADVPMDGEVRRIYGGRKCTDYCDVREWCFRLAGRPEF